MVSFEPPKTEEDVLEMRREFKELWARNGIDYTDEELVEMFPLGLVK